MAYNPVSEIKYEAGILTRDGKKVDQDPLEYLHSLAVKHQKSSHLPFVGGAIGFMGYDMISLYEAIGQLPPDTIGMPDMHFFLYDSYLIVDHKKAEMTIVEDSLYSQRSEDQLEQALQAVLENLKQATPEELAPLEIHSLQFKSHLEQEQFETMVKTAKDLIRQGDMFQCVLSQRFSAPLTGKPLDFYRNLRLTNPSNYLYFFDFGDYQVIGASPESLVSVKDGQVVTNPIAGTRPRGNTPEEDQALAEDLLSDIKEVAEHRMLVDLGRNDVGKIAEVGSVALTKYMEVEHFRYVMHLTSVVKGQLLTGRTCLDALKSIMPAGTVSGAPKIRAMQRINQLETEKRGLYAGVIGYLSSNGSMDFAIAIRTMVVKDQRVYVQAGAGIVYDSVPEKEYQETLNKAKAMMKMGEKA